MQEKPVSKKQEIGFLCFLIGFIVLILNNPLWSDAKGATKTLEEAGYRQVEILPYKFLSHCGRIGPFITRFEATTQDGKVVAGKVCRTFLGNAYIKLNKK